MKPKLSIEIAVVLFFITTGSMFFTQFGKIEYSKRSAENGQVSTVHVFPAGANEVEDEVPPVWVSDLKSELKRRQELAEQGLKEDMNGLRASCERALRNYEEEKKDRIEAQNVLKNSSKDRRALSYATIGISSVVLLAIGFFRMKSSKSQDISTKEKNEIRIFWTTVVQVILTLVANVVWNT